MHRAEAFMAIHDPVDRKNFDNALQTLRYEEALICQTALVKSRDASRKSKATACPETRLKDDFIASLPFALTTANSRSSPIFPPIWRTITPCNDCCKARSVPVRPWSRLLP